MSLNKVMNREINSNPFTNSFIHLKMCMEFLIYANLQRAAVM